jgi:hypothetical protein
MTNNSQTIYLEEPTSVGSDDETTIVFTENMNRISFMMGPGPTSQRTNAKKNDNNNDKNQEQTTIHKDPFGQIVPDNEESPRLS